MTASHFDEVLAVLAGQSSGGPRTTADRKMLSILRHGEGVHGHIGRTSFEAAWVAEGRLRPAHPYYQHGAPALVALFMGALGVQRITAPIVGTIAADYEPLLPGRPHVHSRVVWLLPPGERLDFVLRPLGEKPAPPTGPVPADGPWALPELPPAWTPFPPRFLELPTPRPCPHCGHEATRYRELDDGVWVCQACGRSFDPSQPLAVSVETAAGSAFLFEKRSG